MASQTKRDIPRLVEHLRRAEYGVEAAHAELIRFRNSVDSAGELQLWEQVDSAERARLAAIAELDEIV